MVLTFACKNFRSIKHECEIDFRKMNLNQYKESLINNEVLPVAVIYGPNGGGKTTVILAMQYLCAFVSAPINQIKGLGIYSVPPLKPFMLDMTSRNEPSEFSIVFNLNKDDSTEYRYNLSIHDNVVCGESLYEKGEKGKPGCIFDRNKDGVRFGDKYKNYSIKTLNITPSISALAILAIMYNDSVFGRVGNWFTQVGILDFGNPLLEVVLPNLLTNFISNNEISPIVNSLLKETKLVSSFEVVDNNIISAQNNGQKIIKTYHDIGGKTYELTYNDESMGTKKMIQLAPSVAIALLNGGLVVIDELDAKIHPKLLEYIISLFTNQNVNRKGAQLFFTSHDMYTLSGKVFRRDEIWFACKDKDESTVVYSLADIKSDDNRIMRSDLSFSKQYLQGRYGADPYYNKMIAWEDLNEQ